jgi:glycosyltransferase involved in cell wall biosynthesis
MDRPPDVVFSFGSGMARLAFRPPLAGLPLILDLVDVDSRKWRDLAAASPPPLSWVYSREAKVLGAFEARAAAMAVATLVVNEREAAIARRLAPSANVQVISNGVELERLKPAGPPSERARVVFCGVMNYGPNDQGMRWFVTEVWPLVKRSRPDATLAVVGADPTTSLKTLCARDNTIELTGRVPDVRPWLWESAVGLAPLQVARGVQNKALEAIAAGLPIVITPAVAEGLPVEGIAAASVAESPEAFAQQVLALLSMSPEGRRARASLATFSTLRWADTLSPLEKWLEAAIASSKHSS